MLNIGLIALIIFGLTLHRYLSAFYDQGMLPYSNAFLIFANLFALTYVVSFIWMFGAVAGVIVALLCFFQVPYHAVLWIFVIIPNFLNKQAVTNIRKNPSYNKLKLYALHSPASARYIPFALNRRMNLLAYYGFCILPLLVAALTAVNFFVSPYKIMWILIRTNVWTIMFVLAGVLFLGNVARVACYKLWLRRHP